MPFFQPPLRLDDFQRASSAYPVASTSAARLPDSPSPNKKRRVGSVPPSLATGQRGPHSTQSKATSQSPAPRPQAASRKSASDAARRSEINARYAELSRDEARLQATLRLQDAWEDIQRRHSNLAVVSDSGEQRGRNSSGQVEQRKKRYRHRPGRTRALPVEEDDIIDLSTLDFVQDRGVLRSSKAGGFAIGRYGNGRDGGDILVGLDTGGGGAKGGAASSAGDTHGSDGDEDDPTDEEDDEEEDGDEWADYTDSDAPSYSSDDELGEDDDLLPPPSLLFREQRRKEAERLREMREFQEHEAKARGGELVARAQQLDEVVVLRGGNVQLPAPIGPPQSAPRRRLPPSLSTDDDEDDLALSPLRARSAAPAVSTPTRSSSKAASQPPSSTATLRRSVSDIRLDSPASTARTPPRRASTVRPTAAKRSASVAAAGLATQDQSANGIRSPPASFSTGPVPPARPSSLSRPPVSSSPLREVITVASPTPPPPPPSSAVAAATRTVSSRRPRPKSPSPELFAPPEASSSARVTARYSPELSVPVPVPYQQATPTPTPPPMRTSPARKPPTVPAHAAPTKPSARKKIRHSSFELIIDVKPPRSTQPPAPATMKRSTGPKKVVLASSVSMPNLPAAAGDVAPDLAAAKSAALLDEEAQAPHRVGGLSTPPLSKRSTVSRRSPSKSPAKARAPSTASPARARVTATPSVILPAPPTSASAPTTRGEDDSDEDELMLSSPIKPTQPHRRPSSVRPSMTPAPSSLSHMPSRPRARSRSVSVLDRSAAASTTSERRLGGVQAVLDDSSEDELGQCIRRPVTVASPAVDLTPQHAAWLLELVVSVSTTCHLLAIVSYLLSPAHFLILAYRIVLQVQFTLPRRVHANRSLRFFVALWGIQALVAIVLHVITGSQGTKGPTGYVQRGLVLDFVGQVFTPSTLHLVGLDVLLAFLQLVTIVLAFGATVPTDLDATTSTESSRDYSSLLGIDDNYEDEAEGREPFNANGSGFSRGRSGYSALADVEEDGARPSVFDMEMDDLGVGTSSKYSSLSSSDPALRLRVPVPLIASVRIDTIWREVRKSASQDRAEREEGGLRGLEEGRGPT